jgi:hypothetical protein
LYSLRIMELRRLEFSEYYVLIFCSLLNHNQINYVSILDLEDLQNNDDNVNYIVKKKMLKYYDIYHTNIENDDVSLFVVSVVLSLKNHFSNKGIELIIDIEMLKEIELQISKNSYFIDNLKLMLEKLNENMHKIPYKLIKMLQTVYNLPLTNDNLLDISNIEPICIANLENYIHVVNKIDDTYSAISLKLIDYINNL